MPCQILLTLLLVLLVPAAAACGAAPQAAVDCARYAAPRGDDRADGTAQAPFRTPDRLAASLRPGQTGCLRGGTYRAVAGDRPFVLYLDEGGRRGAPIRLRSHPGERALLRGIVVVGDDADHVVLEHLAIEGTGEQNTVKIYGEDVVVQDSEITNRSRGESCFILGSGDEGPAERTVIRRNYIHDCGARRHGNKDHAIYAASVRDGQIRENLIVNPAAYAVHLYPDAQRTRVTANVIDGGDGIRGGIIIAADHHSVPRGNIVERNVIAHVATHALGASWKGVVGTGNVVRDNCVWRAGEGATKLDGVAERGTIVADPLFRDRAARDYRLGRSSRCRDLLGADVAAQLAERGLLAARTRAARTSARRCRTPRTRRCRSRRASGTARRS